MKDIKTIRRAVATMANLNDKYAVAVVIGIQNVGYAHIGYLPRTLSQGMAAVMDAGVKVRANLQQIIGGYRYKETLGPWWALKPFEWNGRKYLPVALDSFGNDVVIDLQTGKVAFSDHETGGLTVLCEDLRSFIKICNSEPVSSGAVKSVEQRELREKRAWKYYNR